MSPQPLGLKLYVAGDAPNSVVATANLRSMLEEHKQHADIEIIDVLLEPQRAMKAGILVTPTLVKVSPAPECRIIGNLRDRKALVAALRLNGVSK